ncbi:peptidyl-prolyl cis-trans isomerase B-like [Diadema setosum]|uniref:peptidyl-prolyl cis-trans isomerase B-like n=1 Tax=Diadema setosum TaxID=31175 RepID=UPI003B39FD99
MKALTFLLMAVALVCMYFVLSSDVRNIIESSAGPMTTEKCFYETGTSDKEVGRNGGDVTRGDYIGCEMAWMATEMMMTALGPNHRGPGWMNMAGAGRNVGRLLFSISRSSTIETSWLDGKHIVG